MQWWELTEEIVCHREKRQTVVFRNNQNGKKERSSRHNLGMHKQGLLDTSPAKGGLQI